MSYAAARNEQAREGIVRFGVVTAVDAGAARAKVSFGGESESAWLPWLAERAATIKVWAPVAIGEQVVVLSESGDTAQGVILSLVFISSYAAPSGDGAEHLLQLGASSISVKDDAIIITSNGSTITIDAGGIRLDGARIDLN